MKVVPGEMPDIEQGEDVPFDDWAKWFEQVKREAVPVADVGVNNAEAGVELRSERSGKCLDGRRNGLGIGPSHFLKDTLDERWVKLSLVAPAGTEAAMARGTADEPAWMYKFDTRGRERYAVIACFGSTAHVPFDRA